MSASAIPLPPALGVMVLPAAVLFPSAMLPLYIFEPRYRSLLRRALETHRMFAVGQARSGNLDPLDVFEVGGAGVVRACVSNPDGTSNLILQGACRVRFIQWIQVAPYRIARVEALDSVRSRSDEATALAAEVHEMCEELASGGIRLPAPFSDYLSHLDDPGELGDVLASALVTSGAIRQRLIEELDVPTRLKLLLGELRARVRGSGGG